MTADRREVGHVHRPGLVNQRDRRERSVRRTARPCARKDERRGGSDRPRSAKSTCMDVSRASDGLRSARSLIPFLEHDEGHRALMGTNMQRQAVPLIESRKRPLVGTGIRDGASRNDSGDVIIADKPGVVTYVSADIIRRDERRRRPRAPTSRREVRALQPRPPATNQRPIIVDEGERVEAGDRAGRRPRHLQTVRPALGKNLLVAFMPWERPTTTRTP